MSNKNEYILFKEGREYIMVLYFSPKTSYSFLLPKTA